MPEVRDEIILAEPVVDRSPELRRNPKNNGILGASPKAVKLTVDPGEGVRGDGAACAIAAVIKRETGLDSDISSEHPTVGGVHVGMTPPIIDWIGRYDRGEQVDALTFTLNLPEEGF